MPGVIGSVSIGLGALGALASAWSIITIGMVSAGTWPGVPAGSAPPHGGRFRTAQGRGCLVVADALNQHRRPGGRVPGPLADFDTADS